MAKYTYVQYIASAGFCIVNIVDHHIVDTLLKKRCILICSVKQAILAKTSCFIEQVYHDVIHTENPFPYSLVIGSIIT